MHDVAWVALFSGSATVIVAALGGYWPIRAENHRAEHERQRIEEAREADERAAREGRLRQATDRTRSAVLLLAVTVRICMDIRRDQHARLNDRDLVEALARARDCYYEANMEIETLRALVSPQNRSLEALDGLISAVAKGFSHVRSASSEQGDPDQVEGRIRESLREVTHAVQMDPQIQESRLGARDPRHAAGPSGSAP
jgi:hypothetical protein